TTGAMVGCLIATTSRNARSTSRSEMTIGRRWRRSETRARWWLSPTLIPPGGGSLPPSGRGHELQRPEEDRVRRVWTERRAPEETSRYHVAEPPGVRFVSGAVREDGAGLGSRSGVSHGGATRPKRDLSEPDDSPRSRQMPALWR